jgi:hypothetical protein
VSRIRTATAFRLELRKIHEKYEHSFKPLIEDVRSTFAQNPLGQAPPHIDENLEAHIRVYMVNALYHPRHVAPVCAT